MLSPRLAQRSNFVRMAGRVGGRERPAAGRQIRPRAARCSRGLEPVAVRVEQDASEFRKPVGAVLKGAQDCFTVGDRERDDAALDVVGVFEDFGLCR